MSHSTLTAKGQITIPREVRQAVGLRAGDRVHYRVLADGTIILRVKNRRVRDLAVKPKGARHVSVEQMNR
ncbi:MAG: AbrB/MazE/SpoVT family DNA-binding domain-containing protein [Gammaproteobacteria bacterium]|nr:AbrB/MazE/SpoVT family DNA-binding domain-containing protein [Gammaproteobacteria bacterium]